jgi:hypothetical protein
MGSLAPQDSAGVGGICVCNDITADYSLWNTKSLSQQLHNYAATRWLHSETERALFNAQTHRAAVRQPQRRKINVCVMQNAPLIYASLMQLVKCSERKLWMPSESKVHAASLSERSAHSFAGKIAIAHLETLKKRCGANKLIAPLWLDMCHKHAVPLLPVFPQRLKLNWWNTICKCSIKH